MNADTNIKTITQVYEAFGRGDVPAEPDVLRDVLVVGHPLQVVPDLGLRGETA